LRKTANKQGNRRWQTSPPVFIPHSVLLISHARRGDVRAWQTRDRQNATTGENARLQFSSGIIRSLANFSTSAHLRPSIPRFPIYRQRNFSVSIRAGFSWWLAWTVLWNSVIAPDPDKINLIKQLLSVKFDKGQISLFCESEVDFMIWFLCTS